MATVSTVNELEALNPNWSDDGLTWDEFGTCSQTDLDGLVNVWFPNNNTRKAKAHNIWARHPRKSSAGVGLLISRGLPSTYHQVLSSSEPHVHKYLEDVECEIGHFGMVGSLHELIREVNNDSGFLSAIKGQEADIPYNGEATIESFVKAYIKDLINGMGLANEVLIFAQIEVLKLRTDLWQLLVDNVPFMIIEVKIPGDSILVDPKAIAQLSRYMEMMRNYHNVNVLFGVLTTMVGFRIMWPPDCDHVARSTSMEPMLATNVGPLDRMSRIHGTDVILGSDPAIHHYIASSIYKAYQGIRLQREEEKKGNLAMPLLEDRVAFKVNGESLLWSKCSVCLLSPVLLSSPHFNCSNFFLVKDLHYGTKGRVWLALSESSKGSSVCTLKFYMPKTNEVGVAAKRARSHVGDKECNMWSALGYSARCLTLFGSECLLMPWAITVNVINGIPAGWDCSCLNEIKKYLRQADRDIIDAALSMWQPAEALKAAVNHLIATKLYHMDIEWRHVALIVTSAERNIFDYFRGSPQSVVLKADLIDYDKAELPPVKNAAEENRMKMKMEELLAMSPTTMIGKYYA